MSLVTASTLREYIPEISSNTEIDSELTSLLDRVEQGIASFLGYPKLESSLACSLESSTYTFYVDSPISSDFYTLQLPIQPVTSITSVHSDSTREYGTSTLIDSSTYSLDQKYGQIILKPKSITRYFANKVICVAGYTSGTLPNDLEHAICVFASFIHRSKSNNGKESITTRNGSVKLTPKKMPVEVKEFLYPYRAPLSIF